MAFGPSRTGIVEHDVVGRNERSRKEVERKGGGYVARPLVGGCSVVSEAGVVMSEHESVIQGWDALNLATPYSVLVSHEGVALAKRMPALGGSEKRIVEAMERASAVMRHRKEE